MVVAFQRCWPGPSDTPTPARSSTAALPPDGRPSHAYLFHGPAGAGKRAVARAFAAELLADGAADPDNARERVQHGVHPDLTWVTPSGAAGDARRRHRRAGRRRRVAHAVRGAPPRVRHRARRDDERPGRQPDAQDARGAGVVRPPHPAHRAARASSCRRSPRAASSCASTPPSAEAIAERLVADHGRRPGRRRRRARGSASATPSARPRLGDGPALRAARRGVRARRAARRPRPSGPGWRCSRGAEGRATARRRRSRSASPRSSNCCPSATAAARSARAPRPPSARSGAPRMAALDQGARARRPLVPRRRLRRRRRRRPRARDRPPRRARGGREGPLRAPPVVGRRARRRVARGLRSSTRTRSCCSRRSRRASRAPRRPRSTEAREMAIVRKRAMMPSVMSIATEIAVALRRRGHGDQQDPGRDVVDVVVAAAGTPPSPAPSVPPNT